MLRIRFSRTGKVGQPSYRIVVAKQQVAVKGRYLEKLGHYLPARNPKVVVFNKEKLLDWIKKGALPTGSVASLLKKHGIGGMDQYLFSSTHHRKKKGESKGPAPAALPTNPPTAPSPVTPA